MLQMSKEKRLHNGRQGRRSKHTRAGWRILKRIERSWRSRHSSHTCSTTMPKKGSRRRLPQFRSSAQLNLKMKMIGRHRCSRRRSPMRLRPERYRRSTGTGAWHVQHKKTWRHSSCLLRSSLSTKPSKKQNKPPGNDSQRQTIPKLQQKRFLKKLAGEKLRNKKNKVARDFDNSSDRRIDATPGRRRQAVLMRWEREKGDEGDSGNVLRKECRSGNLLILACSGSCVVSAVESAVQITPV